VKQFGDDAAVVRQAVVDATAEAHERGLAAQEVSGLPTKQPYGGVWPVKFLALVQRLAVLPSAYVVRPPGAPYRLVVVNDRLLLPFRHATALTKPVETEAQVTTQLARDLSKALSGAEPTPTLFDEVVGGLVPARPEVSYVPPETKIIYLPFVSNADTDRLLGLWWGEATSDEDGHLTWTYLEELPVSAAPPASGSWSVGWPRPLPLPSAPGGGSAQGFGEGELPDLDVTRRSTPVEQPQSEIAPDESAVDERDE
jgi:hypothetical protein